MQRLEIDCQNGQKTWIDLALKEETILENERQSNVQKALLENKLVTKRNLVQALLELREIRQNQDIFSNDDIAEKQSEINKLKEKLV